MLGGAVLCGAWLATAAWAADPQTYKVRLEGSVSKEIESTLAASSDLLSLRKSAPVSPVGLILRARGDTVRLKTVLESYGYYQSAVTATIDGAGLTSADLAEKLAAAPAGKDAEVVVSFVPGPQYHVGKITIEGDLPEPMRAKLNLHPGQPAVAADVLNAGNRLLTALQDLGYAFAKVEPPVAYELPDTQELEVSFQVQTGAIVRFGTISVTGLRRTQQAAVLLRLQLHTGDQYSAQALDKARRNLLGMGVFGTVDVRLGTQPDANGEVPVTFRVTERKRHEVILGAAYSSDLGGSGTVTWSDRNVFGHAEQLDLTASIINLNGSATTALGYDTGAKLTLPEFLHPQQTLQFSLDAIKQSLLAYDQTAETAGITLSRTLSKVWSASAGFTTKVDTIYQPQEVFVANLNKSTFYYTLFAIPLSLRYDSTDLSSLLLDPTHGIRAALTVAPTLSLGPPNATYVISQIRASAYLDLHDLSLTAPGRTVIAVRGLYGYAQGATVTDLPPDQRFYAGGSETVRGYRFESVGPQFSDTAPANAQQLIGSSFSEETPVGGVAVDAGSVELRQRVGRNYGFAVFADAGRIGQTAMPFTGKYAVGVGAGVRYYTPIGPLRLDFALPLHRSYYDDRFEVYIGLGQSF
jgi:translocation and assembly module TamA